MSLSLARVGNKIQVLDTENPTKYLKPSAIRALPDGKSVLIEFGKEIRGAYTIDNNNVTTPVAVDAEDLAAQLNVFFA